MSEKTTAEHLQDASDSLKSIQRSLSFMKGLAYGALVGIPLGFALGWVVFV
jgi:ABC-type nitrate/sulfonate/bicarbonate transport system permease component